VHEGGTQHNRSIRSPDGASAHSVAGLGRRRSTYARLHIQFEAGLPREPCVDIERDKGPSFYPEWDKALPPWLVPGFYPAGRSELSVRFDWLRAPELRLGIDHAICSRDYSITHTPVEGNGVA